MMTAVGQSLLRVQSSEMLGHNCLEQTLGGMGRRGASSEYDGGVDERHIRWGLGGA